MYSTARCFCKKHEAPPNVCFGSITKKNVTKNSVNLDIPGLDKDVTNAIGQVYDSSTALLGLSSHDVASLRTTCLCPSRVLGSNFSSGFALINQNQSAMQWLFNLQEHVWRIGYTWTSRTFVPSRTVGLTSVPCCLTQEVAAMHRQYLMKRSQDLSRIKEPWKTWTAC